jgi:predicted ATP-dependent protease
VAADFDERFDRDGEHPRLYARLVATLLRQQGLQPFSRDAVARVLEQSARAVDDSRKLSADLESLSDLLREADFHARRAGRETVDGDDVEAAVEAQIQRLDRVRDRIQEEIARGTLKIDTAGAVVGQVNGLAVLGVGSFSFGRPSRITAGVSLGKGEVVDIEREVELGGPLHSKGVLILGGFLASRFARERPLSLSASLVFEQSYGGVDGDSASSAELYALLSALAEVPLRQDLAVTGSVNQRGEVQAIGGVNDKIEGFFDVCAARGLTGEQGVLIPASNTQHLMLRRRVVEAVAAGRFHVYPVAHVDEGIELLTGLAAGARGDDGSYPAGSFNRRVEERLAELAAKRREYDQPPAPPAPPEPPGEPAEPEPEPEPEQEAK